MHCGEDAHAMADRDVETFLQPFPSRLPHTVLKSINSEHRFGPKCDRHKHNLRVSFNSFITFRNREMVMKFRPLLDQPKYMQSATFFHESAIKFFAQTYRWLGSIFSGRRSKIQLELLLPHDCSTQSKQHEASMLESFLRTLWPLKYSPNSACTYGVLAV